MCGEEAQPSQPHSVHAPPHPPSLLVTRTTVPGLPRALSSVEDPSPPAPQPRAPAPAPDYSPSPRPCRSGAAPRPACSVGVKPLNSRYSFTSVSTYGRESMAAQWTSGVGAVWLAHVSVRGGRGGGGGPAPRSRPARAASGARNSERELRLLRAWGTGTTSGVVARACALTPTPMPMMRVPRRAARRPESRVPAGVCGMPAPSAALGRYYANEKTRRPSSARAPARDARLP